MPAPSATGVRIAGDRYQWLVAWGACVDALLDAGAEVDNPIVNVGIEADGAGNLDDVVVYRRRPPHAYMQVKYTVDSSTPVNTAYLTEPSPSGGPSILRKIATSWQSLARPGEPIELAIVTNRLADHTDPLIAGRDSRTGLLLPKAAGGSARSAIGRARASWAADTDLSDSELLELLSVLTFDLGHDLEHLTRIVRLSMAVAGLRSDEAALDVGIDWIEKQVIQGHRQIGLDEIRDAIQRRGLQIEDAGVIVSIATLVPDPLAEHAAYALDWVDRFDGYDANLKRRPMPPATWKELQADIETIPSHLGPAKRTVITGSMRLAPAFAVGAVMRMVTGVDVAVVQRGEMWRSDAPYATPVQPVSTEFAIDQGIDLAVAIEISAPMADDVIAWLRESALPVRRLVAIAPSDGPRDNAVDDAEAASALAVGIRDTVRSVVKGHPRVHLFMASPMGLALLLGHRWNRIAPTVVYEDLAALGYEAAFSVSA